MQYDWDSAKRKINLNKHQIDFEEIEYFDWDTAIFQPGSGHDEERWIAYGYLNARLHAVIYTDRDDVRRIISLRKANPPRKEEI